MSLFPSRLKPGGTLTIHLSSSTPAAAWVHNQIFVVDPNGRRTLVSDRLQPILPMDISESDFEVEKKAGEPFQSTPILMAARYLQRDGEDLDAFVRTLKRLRDSTHQYVTYQLDADAPLGRYHLELESTSGGDTMASGTAATDYFFVERLLLREVRSKGTETEALVENPSPEPALAKLCVSSGSDFQVRLLSLPPKTVTPLSYEGAAFLSYLGGAEVLRLAAPDDPFCLRNPSMVTTPKGKDLTYIFSTQEKPGRAFELEGVAARIWDLADGFHTRSFVRHPDHAKEYDEMVRMRLLLEIA